MLAIGDQPTCDRREYVQLRRLGPARQVRLNLMEQTLPVTARGELIRIDLIADPETHMKLIVKDGRIHKNTLEG